MQRLTTVSEYALKRTKGTEIFKRYGLVFLFLSPYLVFFLMFCIYPLIYGVYMSLMKFSIGDYSLNEWRGLQNFITILFGDSMYHDMFWYAMGNTVKAALILVPLGIVLPLIFAVLINSQPRGYKVFRALIYLPSVFPVSASGVMFAALFGTNFGYINQWLGTNIDWLSGSPTTAWFVIILLCVWGGWGGNFMIFSAALKNIDKSLYEAASVDGCTGFRRVLSVTLPAIKPQLILCTFTTIIGYFGLYGQVYILTNGGPSIFENGVNYNSTMTIMWYLQNMITNPSRFDVYGMVSAMGLTLGVIIGIITGLQLFITRERPSGTKISAAYAEYIKARNDAATGAEDGAALDTVEPIAVTETAAAGEITEDKTADEEELQ